MRVESGIDVARPPAEVFAYISDFENNPAWQGGMVEARFTTEPPLRVGSRYDQVATMMGRRIESSFEVIEYEPGRMVKATTTKSSFPITFTRIVTPIFGGTRVTAIVEGDSSGFFKLAEPLMRRKVRKSIDADYRNLKRILEAG